MTLTEMRPNILETVSEMTLTENLRVSYDGYTTAERETLEEQRLHLKTEVQPRLDWQEHLRDMAKFCGNIVLGEE